MVCTNNRRVINLESITVTAVCDTHNLHSNQGQIHHNLSKHKRTGTVKCHSFVLGKNSPSFETVDDFSEPEQGVNK
jgi:hypothetical protein